MVPDLYDRYYCSTIDIQMKLEDCHWLQQDGHVSANAKKVGCGAVRDPDLIDQIAV